MIAWCLRFIRNCRIKTEKSTKARTRWLEVKELTVSECKKALAVCLRRAQLTEFEPEMRCLEKSIHPIIPESSIVKRFEPILDEFGQLRIGGKLSNAKLDYDEMHPVILPTKHLLKKVIVREHHVRNGPPSPEKLLHALRSKYWLIAGRPLLKSVVNKCVSCKKQNAQPMSTIMAPLPEHQVTPFRPAFAFT